MEVQERRNQAMSISVPFSIKFEQNLLIKVKEAIINLLFSFDSFAMFIDQRDETSIRDIAAFILQYSYLFESKKIAAQGAYPAKLLAQFLQTYLRQVPQNYQAQNYNRLFKEIQGDCKIRFHRKKQIASKNKQLLLLTINTMQKYMSDV